MKKIISLIIAIIALCISIMSIPINALAADCERIITNSSGVQTGTTASSHYTISSYNGMCIWCSVRTALAAARTGIIDGSHFSTTFGEAGYSYAAAVDYFSEMIRGNDEIQLSLFSRGVTFIEPFMTAYRNYLNDTADYSKPVHIVLTEPGFGYLTGAKNKDDYSVAMGYLQQISNMNPDKSNRSIAIDIVIGEERNKSITCYSKFMLLASYGAI